MQKYMNDLDNSRLLEPCAVLVLPMLLTINFHHDKLASIWKRIIERIKLYVLLLLIKLCLHTSVAVFKSHNMT